jgi:hypothetical protein
MWHNAAQYGTQYMQLITMPQHAVHYSSAESITLKKYAKGHSTSCHSAESHLGVILLNVFLF